MDAWNGSFLDPNGREGRIELIPLNGPRSTRGTLHIQIAERESVLDVKGQVEIERGEASTHLRLVQQLTEGRLEWQAELTPEDAAPYAKAALVGQYRATGGGREVPLTRGVMILWQFEGP